MENFINDGYTEAGYIAAVERMHGEMRFTYRPMLPEEVDEAQAVLDQNNVARSHGLIRGILVKRIIDWSSDLPVTVESLRTIRPVLWNRIYMIVAGRSPSDPDPKATPEDVSTWTQDMLEAGGTGGTVGEARTERDSKNSETG